MNAAIEWANGLAGHWARGMWPVLWQTAALAVIVGLIVLCNRRMSPALKFWLWMLVPLRLLVMPLIVIALPVLPSPPVVQMESPVAPTRFISQAPVEAQAHDSAVQPEPPSIVIPSHVRASIWTWLMAGWFAGIGFFALRLARGWLKMKAVANQAQENSDPRVRDCAREAAAMLDLRKIPRILSAAEGVSPFVLGFFRPVVVLPAALADHVTPEELRTVLAHEFAHVRRRDALAGWVLACSDVIYFFNPIAHLVKRAIIFERERACDEQVLALTQAPRAVYARALLSAGDLNRAAATRLSCAPVLLESGQHLERRLKSIAEEQRPRAALSRTAKVAMLAITLLALPGIALTARSETAPAPRDSRPAERTGAELRTYDVTVPDDWKDVLSVGKFSLVGGPFYGVPWNWGVWTCIRVKLPLKNLTTSTLYEQLSYRTESKVEGCSNAEMGVCYTLNPKEERVIDAIVPISSTERPVKFLLRMWNPVKTPPAQQTPWREIGLVIDPLPVSSPSVPGEKIDIMGGEVEHFAVEEIRLKHEKEENFLVAVVRNKTDKALPLGISVAVNDPRNVENNVSPTAMDHGSFASRITTVDAGSAATVSVPCEIRPIGNPLLAFSLFEPRPGYDTYSESSFSGILRRDVTPVAWGVADLFKAAERGDCVLPPILPLPLGAGWSAGLTLDAPDLHDGVVAAAVFDNDPVPGFKSRVLKTRSFTEYSLEQPSATPQTRQLIIESQWDYGFGEVTGKDVFFLRSGAGEVVVSSRLFVSRSGSAREKPFGEVSGSVGKPGVQRWLVTKAVLINGKTLCWCIPFESKTDGVRLTLTEKNALDLAPIFDEIIPPSFKPAESLTVPEKAAPSATAAPASGAASPLDLKIKAVSLPGVSLREALEILQTQVGKDRNFVVDPHVDTGRITLDLKNVTLGQTLAAILKGSDLVFAFVPSDDLIYISTKDGCAAYEQYPEPAVPDGEPELRQMLDKKTKQVSLPGVSLSEAVAILKATDWRGVKITIDPAALKAARGTRIFVELHDVPLRVALKNMLLPKDLYYDIVDDSISITIFSMRQYDVSDILTQMDGKKLLELIVERTGRELGRAQIGLSGPSILGGPSDHQPSRLMYVRGIWLMVCNTNADHKKIESVLQKLREAPSGTVESRGAATAATP